MTILRGITAFGLCLFLALTSVGLAVARGAAQPAGQIVLCTGEGLVKMAVDADGMPMEPPHVCPDCLLALYAVAPRAPLGLPRALGRPLNRSVAKAHHAAGLARPTPLARAPPRPG